MDYFEESTQYHKEIDDTHKNVDLIVTDSYLYENIKDIISIPFLTFLTINFSNKEIRNDILIMLKKVKTLKKLEISFLYSHNYIPEAIYELINITTLHINNIEISKLSEDICKLKDLERLWIYGTDITTLPDSIGKLKNLKHLEVEGNKINHLPSSIGDLKLLKTLHLFNNELMSLPESLCNLHNLEKLDISYNEKLVVLPQYLEKLKSKDSSIKITCESTSNT